MVTDPLLFRGDYEDEAADLRWHEERTEEWVESIGDKETTETDLLHLGKAAGAL